MPRRGPGLLLRKSANCPCGRTTALRNVSDRKSTRLNSSHVEISYAVFCLKKKKKKKKNTNRKKKKTNSQNTKQQYRDSQRITTQLIGRCKWTQDRSQQIGQRCTSTQRVPT